MVRSRVATALKLDLSYLERLLTWSELHTRDPTSGFDERFVVKLVDNYRSHPSILRLPSDLFYDGELVACANVRERSIFERWEALPNAEFPVLFHGVRGKDEREANSPSWFNADELVLVSRYVEDVLRVRGTGVKSSDIAVITPYR